MRRGSGRVHLAGLTPVVVPVVAAIVKFRLTAVSDAQHGGFTTGSSPVSWGAVSQPFVNLTIPTALTELLGAASSIMDANHIDSMRGRTFGSIVRSLSVREAQVLSPVEWARRSRRSAPDGSRLAEPNQVLGQLLDPFLAIDLQELTGLEPN